MYCNLDQSLGSLIDLSSMINIIKNVKKFSKLGKPYIYIRKPWAIFITGKEKSYNIKLILYFIKIKLAYCPSTKVHVKCTNIDLFELGEK